MGVLDAKNQSFCRNPVMRPRAFVLFVIVSFFMVFGAAAGVLALQKNTLGPEGAAPAEQGQKPAAPAPGAEQGHAAPGQQPAQPHGGAEQPSAPSQHAPAPQAKAPEAQHGAAPGAAEHGAESHGGDHVVLPEISPVAGVTFVDTVIKLLDYEIHGRTLGWRPNDLIIGRFTDDINNYQLGVLEAIRFTTLRLKDSLTRMGDADTYDPDLEQAVNLLMNSATLWWFPSAESSYSQAIEHLKKFRTKLEKGQRNFYYRRDNFVSLVSAYKDLLGNVNRSLVMPGGWFQADDHFYYAKGVAHVYYEILKVSRVGFKNQLTTMHATDIVDEILHELHITEGINPWIILNSDFSGFFANHRANLNAPLSEVAHLMVVLSGL